MSIDLTWEALALLWLVIFNMITTSLSIDWQILLTEQKAGILARGMLFLTVSIRSFHPTLGETMKIVTWGTDFDKFTVFLTTNEKRIRLDDDRISEAASH